MDDDFNTPKALGAFHQLRGEINKLLVNGLSKATKSSVRESLKKYGEPLGIFQLSLNDWSVRTTSQTIQTASVSEQDIELQIQLRNEARAKKDFATSDTIRKKLADQGITLEDRPDGTTRWKR